MHSKLEKNSVLLLVASIFVISIGGMFEVLPLFLQEATIEKVEGIRPYSPLELAGFNIYIREGCYNCHSQQIRPLRDEVERYGHYSLAAESMYDHPFQWGSKRTGPDLARVGGRYSDDWHHIHLINPRDVVPTSIMPPYAFLAHNTAKIYNIKKDMEVLRRLGVPYTDEMIDNAFEDALAQADPEFNSPGIEKRYPKITMRSNNIANRHITEMDALVAYLQVLGTMVDFKDYNSDLRRTVKTTSDKTSNPTSSGVDNSTIYTGNNQKDTTVDNKPLIDKNVNSKTGALPKDQKNPSIDKDHNNPRTSSHGDRPNDEQTGEDNGSNVSVELKNSLKGNEMRSPSSVDDEIKKKETINKNEH